MNLTFTEQDLADIRRIRNDTISFDGCIRPMALDSSGNVIIYCNINSLDVEEF